MNRQHSVALIAVLVCLSLVAMVLTGDERVTQQHIEQSNTQAELQIKKRDDRAHPVPSQPDSQLPTRQSVALADDGEVLPNEQSPAHVGSEHLGRVILVDRFGTENRIADGRIALSFWNGSKGKKKTVPVSNGYFQIDGLGVGPFRVQELQLNNRAAKLSEPSKRYNPGDSAVVVRASLPQSISLSVLSAVSGEHLSNVTILEGIEILTLDQLGDLTDIKRTAAYPLRLDSPLALEPNADHLKKRLVQFQVHSPEFAWKRIDLDMTVGGERVVRLERGGGLFIELIGELKEPGASLFLTPSRDEYGVPVASVDAGAGQVISLQSLEPGAYIASVRLGPWFDEVEELGRLAVEVVSGRTQWVQLKLEDRNWKSSAQLAGSLTLPREWQVDQLTLSAHHYGHEGTVRHELDPASIIPVGLESGVWSFDFGSLACGEYALVVEFQSLGSSVSHGIQLELGSEGIMDAHLAVPPPAQVRITLAGNSESDEIDLSAISWVPVDEEGRSSSRGSIAISVHEEGLFEFLAPVGRIRIQASSKVYSPSIELLNVHAGLNEHHLSLERNCTALIVFLDGLTNVPINDSWFPKLEHETQDGRLLSVSRSTDGTRVTVSQPGVYSCQMPSIPGFLPVAAQEMHILRTERNEFEVHLIREP